MQIHLCKFNGTLLHVENSSRWKDEELRTPRVCSKIQLPFATVTCTTSFTQFH